MDIIQFKLSDDSIEDTKTLLIVSQLWLKMVKEIQPVFKPRQDWFLDKVSQQVSSPFYNLFILKDEDRIVGFFDLIFQSNEMNGHLEGCTQYIYFLPEIRKKKGLKLVLSFLKKYLKNHNCTHLSGFTVEKNKDLWVNNGFKMTNFCMEMVI